MIGSLSGMISGGTTERTAGTAGTRRSTAHPGSTATTGTASSAASTRTTRRRWTTAWRRLEGTTPWRQTMTTPTWPPGEGTPTRISFPVTPLLMMATSPLVMVTLTTTTMIVVTVATATITMTTMIVTMTAEMIGTVRTIETVTMTTDVAMTTMIVTTVACRVATATRRPWWEGVASTALSRSGWGWGPTGATTTTTGPARRGTTDRPGGRTRCTYRGRGWCAAHRTTRARPGEEEGGYHPDSPYHPTGRSDTDSEPLYYNSQPRQDTTAQHRPQSFMNSRWVCTNETTINKCNLLREIKHHIYTYSIFVVKHQVMYIKIYILQNIKFCYRDNSLNNSLKPSNFTIFLSSFKHLLILRILPIIRSSCIFYIVLKLLCVLFLP